MSSSHASHSGGALPPTLLAGGGSAGHVSPMLSIADAMRRRDPNVPLVALGTAEGMESRLVPLRGYDLAVVPKVPLPRKPSVDLLKVPLRLVTAVRAAGRAIDQLGAQVVVGMGGYVSTPAYFAAKLRGIPIVIHEQNALAGIANKVGARLTSHVITTFETTQLPSAAHLGMPLRREIATLDRDELRDKGRAFFDLPNDGPVLLVTGGSLGAQAINEAVADAASAVKSAGISVLHITGRGKAAGMTSSEGPAPYRVVEYVDEMALAYAAADLVLCRSGANTVCELAAVGLPAIYVPLAIGNGEQRRNAEPVVAAGGGQIVANDAISGAWIRDNLIPLATDSGALAAMGDAAATWGVRDADDRIVDVIIAAAKAGK